MASIVSPLIAGWYGSNNFARIVPTEDLDKGYLSAYLLSRYGQYQLKREIFGGIIGHLTENHIRQIKIPLPADPVQKKIGKPAVEAYLKRDRANEIEDETIKVVERTLKEIAEGKFLDIRKEERISFDKMAREYLEIHSKPNKRSSWRDEISIKHFSYYFGKKTLQEITSLDVEKHKQKRVKEVSPSTVNREMTCLKTIFNKAKEWGKIKENQISSVKPFKVQNARLRYLEKEEIARLIQACPGYLKTITTVALNTGMRKGEILSLKWNDIDFRNRLIYPQESCLFFAL